MRRHECVNNNSQNDWTESKKMYKLVPSMYYVSIESPMFFLSLVFFVYCFLCFYCPHMCSTHIQTLKIKMMCSWTQKPHNQTKWFHQMVISIQSSIVYSFLQIRLNFVFSSWKCHSRKKKRKKHIPKFPAYRQPNKLAECTNEYWVALKCL